MKLVSVLGTVLTASVASVAAVPAVHARAPCVKNKAVESPPPVLQPPPPPNSSRPKCTKSKPLPELTTSETAVPPTGSGFDESGLDRRPDFGGNDLSSDSDLSGSGPSSATKPKTAKPCKPKKAVTRPCKPKKAVTGTVDSQGPVGVQALSSSAPAVKSEEIEEPRPYDDEMPLNESSVYSDTTIPALGGISGTHEGEERDSFSLDQDSLPEVSNSLSDEAQSEPGFIESGSAESGSAEPHDLGNPGHSFGSDADQSFQPETESAEEVSTLEDSAPAPEPADDFQSAEDKVPTPRLERESGLVPENFGPSTHLSDSAESSIKSKPSKPCTSKKTQGAGSEGIPGLDSSGLAEENKPEGEITSAESPETNSVLPEEMSGENEVTVTPLSSSPSLTPKKPKKPCKAKKPSGVTNKAHDQDALSRSSGHTKPCKSKKTDLGAGTDKAADPQLPEPFPTEPSAPGGGRDGSPTSRPLRPTCLKKFGATLPPAVPTVPVSQELPSESNDVEQKLKIPETPSTETLGPNGQETQSSGSPTVSVPQEPSSDTSTVDEQATPGSGNSTGNVHSGTVSVTPHIGYGSSVGVLGCHIDVNHVAYWPMKVDCNNLCVKLTHGTKSTYVLRIDSSTGAHDISSTAFNELIGLKDSAGELMQWEDVDMSKCSHLLLPSAKGKLPFTAWNPNLPADCVAKAREEGKSNWVSQHYRLKNFGTAQCTNGLEEDCQYDETAQLPKCPTSKAIADINNINVGDVDIHELTYGS